MRKICWLLVFFYSGGAWSQGALKHEPSLEIGEIIFSRETDSVEFNCCRHIHADTQSVHLCVDESPEYPGGLNAFRTFFSQNFSYPEITDQRIVEGKCYISFSVDTDGSIHSITLNRGVPNCPVCDAEAMRIVSIMPKWNANSFTKRIVKTSYNLMIVFNLK